MYGMFTEEGNKAVQSIVYRVVASGNKGMAAVNLAIQYLNRLAQNKKYEEALDTEVVEAVLDRVA